jgi:hypothetical protein
MTDLPTLDELDQGSRNFLEAYITFEIDDSDLPAQPFRMAVDAFTPSYFLENDERPEGAETVVLAGLNDDLPEDVVWSRTGTFDNPQNAQLWGTSYEDQVIGLEDRKDNEESMNVTHHDRINLDSTEGIPDVDVELGEYAEILIENGGDERFVGIGQGTSIESDLGTTRLDVQYNDGVKIGSQKVDAEITLHAKYHGETEFIGSEDVSLAREDLLEDVENDDNVYQIGENHYHGEMP